MKWFVELWFGLSRVCCIRIETLNNFHKILISQYRQRQRHTHVSFQLLYKAHFLLKKFSLKQKRVCAGQKYRARGQEK